MGQEKLEINGRPKKVFHMKQIIENFKEIDIYLDEKGVTQKADILMLNNRIELVIKDDKFHVPFKSAAGRHASMLDSGIRSGSHKLLSASGQLQRIGF
jgi:hypothetical protein